MKSAELLARPATTNEAYDESTRDFLPRIMRKKIGATAMAALAFSLPTHEVQADEPVKKPIAWTDIGIYPREKPSMNSEHAGPRLYNGTVVAIECETYGQPVNNGYMTTDLWDRLPDGNYLPNAFINTNTSGRTPGVPECNGLDEPVKTESVPESENIMRYSTVGDTLPVALLEHFIGRSGEEVILDWQYFSESPRFQAWLNNKQRREADDNIYHPNPIDESTLYYAIGGFGVNLAQSSECYTIDNSYDFKPDKLENLPFIGLDMLERAKGAKNFNIHASNCHDKSD